MKAYGNLGVFDVNRSELSTLKGTWLAYFDVEGVKSFSKLYGDKNSLSLKLKPHFEGPDSELGVNSSYGLIGEDYQKEFLEDMGLNKSEELVGKIVLGVIDKEKGLRGLVVPKEMYVGGF